MSGISAVIASPRKQRTNWYPFMRGIFTSIITQSGDSVWTRSSPCTPSYATTTWYDPCKLTAYFINSTIVGLSSITNTFFIEFPSLTRRLSYTMYWLLSQQSGQFTFCIVTQLFASANYYAFSTIFQVTQAASLSLIDRLNHNP